MKSDYVGVVVAVEDGAVGVYACGAEGLASHVIVLVEYDFIR